MPGPTRPASLAPVDFDTLQIQFAKTEWFGKRRFEVQGYGQGYSKESVATEDYTRHQYYGVTITKRKIRLALTSATGLAAASGNYILEQRFNMEYDWLTQVLTRIESETLEQLYRKKGIRARILVGENSTPWELQYSEPGMRGPSVIIPSNLQSARRLIFIEQLYKPSSTHATLLSPRGHFTLKENHDILGVLQFEGVNTLCLKHTLDNPTRLLLLSTALLLE